MSATKTPEQIAVIPVGHPGSVGHVPEQVARLIREHHAMREAEGRVLEARSALAKAETQLMWARRAHDAQARAVGDMALRAGWVTPELVSEVRP